MLVLFNMDKKNNNKKTQLLLAKNRFKKSWYQEITINIYTTTSPVSICKEPNYFVWFCLHVTWLQTHWSSSITRLRKLSPTLSWSLIRTKEAFVSTHIHKWNQLQCVWSVQYSADNERETKVWKSFTCCNNNHKSSLKLDLEQDWFVWEWKKNMEECKTLDQFCFV